MRGTERLTLHFSSPFALSMHLTQAYNYGWRPLCSLMFPCLKTHCSPVQKNHQSELTNQKQTLNKINKGRYYSGTNTHTHYISCILDRFEDWMNAIMYMALYTSAEWHALWYAWSHAYLTGNCKLDMAVTAPGYAQQMQALVCGVYQVLNRSESQPNYSVATCGAWKKHVFQPVHWFAMRYGCTANKWENEVDVYRPTQTRPPDKDSNKHNQKYCALVLSDHRSSWKPANP